MNSKSLSRKILVAMLVVMVTIAFCGVNPAETFAATKLKVSPSSKTLTVGKKAMFKANKSVKWTVTKGKKVVKISSKTSKKAVVKALKKGSAVLTAKKGTKKVNVKITVKAAAVTAPKTIALTSTCTHNTVGLNGSCIISVDKVTPSTASKSVTFTSSDETIATVDRTTGQVTSVAEGNVTITATSTVDKNVTATYNLTVVKTQQGTVATKIDMTNATLYPAGKTIKVWVPVAQSTDNQKITDVKVDAPKATKTEQTTDKYGFVIAYIEWDSTVAPADRTATVSFHACRKAAIAPATLATSKATLADVDKTAMADYLAATSKSAVGSDQVKGYIADALKAAGNPTTVVGQTRAIYDWVIANLYRKDTNSTATGKVQGCGDGDVLRIMSEEKPGGHCTDINSVFISMLRTAGIPAREMFGIRMTGTDATKTTDITESQHCRAQFYLPGTGWVEADPADALKMIHNNCADDKTSAEAKGYIEHYWGNNDQNWVQLVAGRDITLTPKQEGPALNNFGYPYAEVDGESVNTYAPKTFTYTIGFTYDTQANCC